MGCGCDEHCGSSWLDKIIHFIKKYEHNTLYEAGDGIEITQEGDTHTITNIGGGGGGVSKEYVDEHDAETLASSKDYTDEQVPHEFVQDLTYE